MRAARLPNDEADVSGCDRIVNIANLSFNTLVYLGIGIHFDYFAGYRYLERYLRFS